MPRKLTTEEFISKAKEIHGDRYGYDNVVYINNSTEVEIVCDKHDVFRQRPDSHMKGYGCRKCGGTAPLTTEEFISKAKEIHGDRYGYDNVVYINNSTEVEIVCKTHGSFEQRPYNHLMGKGCKECGLIKRAKSKTKTTTQFIEQAKIIHKNFYSYNLVKYKRREENVIITCPIHRNFTQTPDNHLSGKGCIECGIQKRSDKQRMSLDEFIKRANQLHKNKYKYDYVKYETAVIDVIITCPDHGNFHQTPSSHLTGSGCHTCGGSKPLTKNDFVKRSRMVHGKLYNYENFIFKNTKTKGLISCKKHKDFPQTPDNHFRGKGCPRCKNSNEGRIAEYLLEKSIVFRQYSIENRIYDFYLPDYNLLIEYDGQQHYYSVNLFSRGNEDYLAEQQKNDAYKTKLASDHGFNIARIPFWLSPKDEKIEIQNILFGQPTYPAIPDPNQFKTKPKPSLKIQ